PIVPKVAVTDDNEPWWEGLDERVPVKDWQGRDYVAGSGKAAHPNSRFTGSAKQCPSYSPQAEAAQGVPISAIVFGGRRASLVPLVFQARDWAHGVLIGAAMASETTAAATGKVGVVRRDPMAMKPFCGYHFGDYFDHWLSFDRPGLNLPVIFHVNWFRKDADGRFLWPGFGENIRVLEWILKRVAGEAPAAETPIGFLGTPEGINLDGLELADDAVAGLFRFDADGWKAEFAGIGRFLDEYAARLPSALSERRSAIAAALG